MDDVRSHSHLTPLTLPPTRLCASLSVLRAPAALLLCPSLMSQDGRTALMQAAKQGKDSCLKLLLEAGCHKEAKDNVSDGWGVVLMACEVIVLGWHG